MVNFFLEKKQRRYPRNSTNFVLVIGDANVIQNDLT